MGKDVRLAEKVISQTWPPQVQPEEPFLHASEFLILFWDFRDALRRKSLCFCSLCKINGFSATRGRNRFNFETAKGRNLKFRT